MPRDFRAALLRIATVVLLAAATAGGAAPIVGYGSSDAVLPAHNHELFIMGFELGLKTKLKKSLPPDFLATIQDTGGSQAAAARSAKTLIEKGVAILTGYPTSHEALLAGEVASRAGVLAVFPAASHSKLAQLGPTVFTTGESMSYIVSTVLGFIKQKFPTAKGLVISNPKSVFSVNQEQSFHHALESNRAYSKLRLTFVHLDPELSLPEKTRKELVENRYDFILFTSYPDELTKVLSQLEQAKVDKPMITDPAWTTGDVELLRRHLTRMKSPIYSFAGWVRGSKESLEFEKALRGTFGKEPSAEVAFGYDVGVIVATVLNRVKGKPTRESVLEAFRSSPCFEGVTSGTLCFGPTGGHANRKLQVVRFTKHNGFQPTTN